VIACITTGTPAIVEHPGRGQRVIDMAVHAAVGHDADQMCGAAAVLQGVGKSEDFRVLEESCPSSMARSIWPRSIATMRPAPIFVCPTSEFPI
jgi:hypothetical protein